MPAGSANHSVIRGILTSPHWLGRQPHTALFGTLSHSVRPPLGSSLAGPHLSWQGVQTAAVEVNACLRSPPSNIACNAYHCTAEQPQPGAAGDLGVKGTASLSFFKFSPNSDLRKSTETLGLGRQRIRRHRKPDVWIWEYSEQKWLL